MTQPVHRDMLFRELRLGHKVLRAILGGNNKNKPYLKICKITKVTEKGVYLDGSCHAMDHPERLYLLGM